MLVQTLVFSVLTSLYVRFPEGLLTALPPVFERAMRALVTASLAFAGYAVVSVIFALVAGARVDAQQNLSLKVQGLFIVPFLANGAIAFIARRGASSSGRQLVAGVASYVVGGSRHPRVPGRRLWRC